MLILARKLSPGRRRNHVLLLRHILSQSPPTVHPSPNKPYIKTPILHFPKPFSSQSHPSPLLSLQNQQLEEENDDDDGGESDSGSLGGPLCPGCGFHMQSSDPARPGFFSVPVPKSPFYHAPLTPLPDTQIPIPLKSGKLTLTLENNPNPNPPLDIVCARCHSLRHYGRVKNPSAEPLLPSFDFDRTVAPRILSPSGPRSVLLLVSDASDFHGSFPRSLSRLLHTSFLHNSDNWKHNKPANLPRPILVLTKLDVLPGSTDVSPESLVGWARARAHELGSAPLAGVHLVSAVKNWGVKGLVEHAAELVGSRGNVWAVGAQNAGKSTLLNAMGRCVAGKEGKLTEAPVPGTTLGIVKVDGVLGGKAKLFDTPGILHPYQITMRLNREEQRMVHVGKELRPRTYRIKAGHSVHIGGLMRVDIEESSVDSIYLTVWASTLLPLHMGRTENASKIMQEHFGRQLQPPIGEDRVAKLGKWERKKFKVSGNSWDASSVDIAVAGLGWVAVGLKGEAVLGVWTYDGVDVVSRSSLIPERARFFEEAGFTVSRIVSQADSIHNKLKHERKEKQHRDKEANSANISSAALEADMIS